jgi:hypothetical protein
MKTLLATSALMALVTLATPSQASAWYCQADGTTGAWGWGASSSLSAARRRALAECAIRTPRGHMCYVSFCR